MDCIASDIAAGARRAARAGMTSTRGTSDRPSRSARAPPKDRSTIAGGDTTEANQPRQRARDPLEEDVSTTNKSTTGAWRFASPSAAEAAKIFGMKEGFGTAGVHEPSADQIWAIRRMYQHAMTAKGTNIQQDPTATIALIRQLEMRTPKLRRTSSTVASDPNNLEVPQNEGDQRNAQVDNAVHTEITPDAPEIDMGYGIDDKTGLAHEPTNGLENNQSIDTGRPKHYASMMFGNKKITIDRAPAKFGFTEPHKLWYYDGAKWSRWIQWQKMNFNSAEWIDKLNKYRDQSARRAGWQKKREGTRVNYTKAQLEWVFELVRLADGKTPEKSVEALATEFNEKFGLEGEHVRTKGGMRALVEKLVREYSENSGQMAKRPRLEKKEEKGSPFIGLTLGLVDSDNKQDADLAEPEKPQAEISTSRSAAEQDALGALMGLAAGI